MQRSATLSPCRQYRYALRREWGTGGRLVMFVGLNPSAADETDDDPTLRRCIGFAQAWGFDGLCMANLFAFRATEPADMKAAADPVGPENDRWLTACAAESGLVVAAWGVHGAFRGRDAEVRRLLAGLHCLALTKGGQPRHPLYLRGALQPVPWACG